ncbi:hypothetical protein [Trichococcus patagoniensis]|uniref:hypothetical protein n=1 Tax=Trichococcus patagoniensis TaxID=382641 RepID=UPI00147424F7|nr:hypothetical protein [Trichococcus patagoniensis]
MVLDYLKASLTEEPTLSEEMVQSLLDKVFDNFPAFLKRAFLQPEKQLPSALAA